MVAPFARFYRPAVRVRTQAGVFENLDGRGIRIEWSCRRDNTSTPDQAQIRFTNLASVTRSALYTSWKTLPPALSYTVQLEAGWDGTASVLMRGQLWDMTKEQFEGPDVITTLMVGDGNKASRDQPVGRSFSGVTITQIISFFVTAQPSTLDAGYGGLGLIMPPESAALITTVAAELPTQSIRNYVPGTSTRAAIDKLMAGLGLTWRSHNGEFIAMRGGIINRPGQILSPRSGLIDYTERGDGGVSLEAMANPEVQPGLQILVQDNLGKTLAEPAYRVESVDYTGDTEGASVMHVEARKAVVLA